MGAEMAEKGRNRAGSRGWPAYNALGKTMTIRPDRWATVERLYHAAQALRAEQRAPFLAEACAGDDELRREVESLLAQCGSADDALTRGAVAAAAGLVSDIGQSMMVGRRFGVYHVLAPLGAGGMGEVYRARDTRLGRDVAIKIVPHEFSALPDRLARCEREARMLAALNHPHIAAIYGIEDDEGIHALVLELVDGETLAERIARGPLPVTQALEIARQIADALDAAHEKGIVHRDLKPANIKITPEGVVKVLDFGLAKLESAGSGQLAAGSPLTESPTITVDGTRAGLIVGTAAYMSPEQARGVAPRSGATPYPFVVGPFAENQSAFSPDGQWVAYESNESGTGEVYVKSFGGAGKQQVSRGGGHSARWKRDGTEIFYLNLANQLMRVGVSGGDTLETTMPTALFAVCRRGDPNPLYEGRWYDLAPDGRFLMPCATAHDNPSITVTVGWASQLAGKFK